MGCFGVIGVQVTTTVMAVGTTLGLLVTPTAAVLSRVADVLSDLWAKWVEQRPIHTLFARKPKAKGEAEADVSLPKLVSEASDFVTLDDAPFLDAPKKKSAEPKKEIVVPLNVYVYQKSSGDYVVSSNVQHLAKAKKAAEADADEAQQQLPGILLKYGQGRELYLRAANNVDNSFTQRATLAPGEEVVYQPAAISVN